MHLKRQQSPKSWPIERKGTTYLVRPKYSINRGASNFNYYERYVKIRKKQKRS